MRIAIVGSGVSGLVAAYLLHQEHEITVFEADARVGGHVHTIDVPRSDATHAVDTGFIVFNELNYPKFCRLLDRLGVTSQSSEVSFSVRCERSDTEYRGSSINTLYAQRRNLFRPGFHRMVWDIFRFFREAPGLLRTIDAELTVGEWLDRKGYSEEFVERHLLPMGAALWSIPFEQMRLFPLRNLLQFFDNHHMLQVKGRPNWRVIQGGSSRYVETLIASFVDRIRTASPVRSIARTENGVRLTTDAMGEEGFDHVILATHADQTLTILKDASPREREILRAFRYQKNQVELHTDTALLPQRKRAWASWNYRVPRGEHEHSSVTYYMNRLQRLGAVDDFCVSLNAGTAVREERRIRSLVYEHPILDRGAFEMQASQDELNAHSSTSFCGAYWGYGFHEDGVRSALAATKRFGVSI